MLSYFVAILSKTLRINFYHNRSSIVEVTTTKFWCVFMPRSVECGHQVTYYRTVPVPKSLPRRICDSTKFPRRRHCHAKVSFGRTFNTGRTLRGGVLPQSLQTLCLHVGKSSVTKSALAHSRRLVCGRSQWQLV